MWANDDSTETPAIVTRHVRFSTDDAMIVERRPYEVGIGENVLRVSPLRAMTVNGRNVTHRPDFLASCFLGFLMQP